MSHYCISKLSDGSCCTAIARFGKHCGNHKLNQNLNQNIGKIDIYNHIGPIMSKPADLKINININSNLLINRRPDLISEWVTDINNEMGIDINSITYSSHKKVYWKCYDKNHKMYIASPNARTSTSQGRSGSGCPECSFDKKRVHDKNELIARRNEIKPIRDTTSIGDETEQYVKDLLINSNEYKHIEIVGFLGGNADISIEQFNGCITYIQIKTLTRIHSKNDTYFMTNDHKYPDNMLIVMLNKERTRFGLEFAGNIKVKRLSLVYDYKKSKYYNIMYKDKNIFLKALIDLIPKSSNINETNEAITKEIKMLTRFEKFCENNNIEYFRNNTNGNAVDGTINGFRFQAKFVNNNRVNQKTFGVSFSKAGGKLNGKNIVKYYEKDDIDFVVVEIGGTIEEPGKYEGNFCIISENVLLDQNILKTETNKGKKSFYICPPFGYEKYHWSKKYWNDISFLI